MRLRFGSICSGIEAASAAWLPLGWHCEFMSEIEPFPRAVLTHHYPDTPLHGDFTTIRAGEYGAIDVLVGGTPCQSFSVAGLRGGLADERGNLALEYLRLAERLRPRWIVWENVPGVLSSLSHTAPDPCQPPDDMEEGAEWVGEDEYDADESHAFECFLAGLSQLGYGWAYRSFDAQFFGLAQRRERVFVVGYLGDWRRAAAVLFEPASLRWDTAPGRETRERIAGATGPSAAVSSGRGWWDDSEIGATIRAQDSPTKADTLVAHCLNAHGGSGRIDAESETFVTSAYRTSGNCGAWDTGDRVDALNTFTDPNQHVIAHSLRADGFDASEDGTGRGTPLVAFQASQSGVREHDTHATLDANNGSRRHNGAIVGSAVRRLTPEECEKLQGFKPGYTAITYRGKPAADGNRYKALGNSMAVPVMHWIGKRIQQVDTDRIHGQIQSTLDKEAPRQSVQVTDAPTHVQPET